MAGVRLEGDIRRLKNTLRALGNLEFQAANKAIGQVLRSSTVQRFKTSKDPEDKSWKPSNNAIANNKKTLVNTARLRNSIRSKVTNKGVAVGTNTIYAATHQFGEKGRTINAKTSKGLRFQIAGMWYCKKAVKITIPARPFLGISKDDMAEIKATMMDVIEGATQ